MLQCAAHLVLTKIPMFSNLKNLAKKFFAATIAILTFATVSLPAQAYTIILGPDSTSSHSSSFKIIDFEAENSIFDPKDDQELELTFTLSADANVTLEVLDEDDETIATLIDNNFYEKGEHSFDWNGRSDEGDFVQYGEYTVKLKIKDGSKKDSETITVKAKKDFEKQMGS